MVVDIHTVQITLRRMVLHTQRSLRALGLALIYSHTVAEETRSGIAMFCRLPAYQYTALSLITVGNVSPLKRPAIGEGVAVVSVITRGSLQG